MFPGSRRETEDFLLVIPTKVDDARFGGVEIYKASINLVPMRAYYSEALRAMLACRENMANRAAMKRSGRCPVCRGVAEGDPLVDPEILEAIESTGSHDAAFEYLYKQVRADVHYTGAVGLHIHHFYPKMNEVDHF